MIDYTGKKAQEQFDKDIDEYLKSLEKSSNTHNHTIKQYQNNKGIVMFIDDRQTYKSIVSYCDITGKKINNDHPLALNFFNDDPYLVMENNG